jgi:surface protein
MTSMFAHCYSLTSINISSFDTSSVTNLGFMFYHCYSLVSLDLSSFDTSKVTRTIDMFNSCQKLEYINLKNFDENSLSKYDNTFYNVPNNIVICINEANIKNKLLPLIKSKKCYNIDCSDNYKLKQKKLVEEIGLCVDKCDNITQNDLDCYKNPKGYYLDVNDTKYKKCFYTCETCEIKGDYLSHNCLTCNSNFTFSINIKNNNYINCYKACNYYFYFDNNNNFYCTSNFSCPDEYPTLKEDKNECIKYDIKNIIKDIIIPETNDTKENVEYYNNILENLETGFTSENYDTKNLDNGEDEVIEIKDIKITFTTTKNQKNNTNNNMTIIDLGDCENLLRNYYNLSENDTLYMKKMDITQPGMKIPKIEYSVYSKLSNNKLEKLNLSICENSKISLSLPIEINENLDKLNTSSGYFNDICYTSTSESGTDISLKDRQKEFVNNNQTVCQENCDFNEYYSDIKKANCSCQVKETTNNYTNMNINKTKLYENFDNNDKK